MLRTLRPSTDDRLLVGAATGDDAAVWLLDDDRALVFTADFITPVVDDARTWGRIAAANSLSDVYAMGGRPLLALNLVCWNDELPDDLLAEVLGGADDIARSAGMVIAGGHTVTDPEPKFGLAVIGEVHPREMFTNAGVRAGQALVLSKPLGIGAITTAIKRGVAPEPAIAAALQSMVTLNDSAAKVARRFGATGATDITGFGFLGHLGRMARESSVDVRIDVARIPSLSGAPELIAQGVSPGGTARNLAWVDEQLDGDASTEVLALLADPQTSGGLLFAVDDGPAAVRALDAAGLRAAIVGVASAGSGRLLLR